jgi:hypothetical protein
MREFIDNASFPFKFTNFVSKEFSIEVEVVPYNEKIGRLLSAKINSFAWILDFQA